MAAITRAPEDSLGLPSTPVAAAKLAAFMVALPALVLGLPALAAVLIYLVVA